MPFTSNNVINPRNEADNKCLMWCLAIHNAIQQGQKSDLCRISKLKKYSNAYNLTGVVYPFVINKSNIKKIEDANDISINIFHYENKSKSIYPLHISTSFTTNKTKQINLLLITDEKSNKHFTYITNYNKLISKQTNNSKTSLLKPNDDVSKLAFIFKSTSFNKKSVVFYGLILHF